MKEPVPLIHKGHHPEQKTTDGNQLTQDRLERQLMETS